MANPIQKILLRACSHGAACALGVALAGSQLGSSCVSTPSEPSDDRYEPYPESSSDRDREDYRIPSDARLVKEGVGELTFRAGSNGRMWLYDEKDRRTLYFVDLLDGDDIVVNPREDRVYINRRSVAKLSLSSERVYRMYFDGRRTWGTRPDYTRPDPTRPDHDRPDHNRPDKPVVRPVPDTAKLVAESKSGGDLAYRAQGTGTLYLWDNSNNALIETFNLRKGQRLLVSPSKDIATLDGKTVMQRKGISKRANYRLLFDVKD